MPKVPRRQQRRSRDKPYAKDILHGSSARRKERLLLTLERAQLELSKPIGDPGRFDNGSPAQLASTLRRTWADHPTSARIVQDVSRYPLVIDKIVEFKGGVVPDNAVQHSGCSRHKRKASPGSERGAIVYEPVYVPTPEVAAVMVARCDVLKVEAKALCGE